MDAFLLAAVVAELQTDLEGAAVRKVFQPNRYDVILRLKGRGPEHRLYISTHPQFSRIHITEHRFVNPPAPPRFCLFLRKHLKGCYIKSVSQEPYERTVTITLRRGKDPDGALDFRLIAELMGRHSNLILVDHRGLIQDCINYITSTQSRVRQIIKDSPYQPPPPRPRPSPENLEAADLLELAAAARTEDDKRIVGLLKGLSPLMAREVTHRILRGESPQNVMADLARIYRERKFSSRIYSLVDEGREILAPIPLTMYEYAACLPFARANRAADEFYFDRVYQQQMNQKKQQIKTRMAKEEEKISRLIEGRRQDLKNLELKLIWQNWGEALKANLNRVPRGASVVELPLPGVTGETALTVELKPDLTPTENMQYLFNGYKKARRGIAVLEEIMSRDRAKAQFLSENLFWLEQARDPEEIEEVHATLIEAGILSKPRGKKKGRKSRKKEAPRPPVSSYRCPEGFKILRGRNSRGNDHLVRTAAGGDLWLHARQIPGSHVLIKRGNHRGDFPADVILQAATLAAYHSRAQHATNVPVDYTEIKFVKRPKDAPPGFVTYARCRTIIVPPTGKRPVEDEEE